MVDEKFMKKEGESSEDFKRRIFANREVYELTWQDVAIIINEQLGYNYSADKYRKESRRFMDDNISEVDLKIFELNKEKVKVRDERTQINAITRSIARDEYFREIALDAAKEAAKITPIESPKAIEVKQNEEKDATLVIGDWHYGLDVNTIYNTYNPDIARERIQLLKEETLNILKQEKIKHVNIVNLGDLISGLIHLPLRINSRLDVVSQTMQVTELLCYFLNDISKKVTIDYYSVLDNHSRIDPKKKDAIRTESFARISDWYVCGRLEGNENIKFHHLENPSEDIATFNIFDHKVIAVHGDRDPQKDIISRLCGYMQTHYDLVLSAHMHHFSADESNETEFFCGGSLIGTDDFAESLRLNSKPSQLLIISTPSNVTRCVYKINLS